MVKIQALDTYYTLVCLDKLLNVSESVSSLKDQDSNSTYCFYSYENYIVIFGKLLHFFEFFSFLICKIEVILPGLELNKII